MLEVIIKKDYLFILFFVRIPQLYLTFTKGISFTCNGHVHVLLYDVKFNGEIDIVQFIFTQCVAYSLQQKLSLHKKVEK